jgi:O-acetyl-ADP-ribose deacetylase (regulator of RNase III)
MDIEIKKYQEIEGDLIKLALEGNFDVIAHGCNCFCTMKRGIAPQMAKAFGCDKFEMEKYTSILKLGDIDFQTFVLGENAVWSLEDAKNNRNEPELTVVNAYTQFNWESKNKPLDYEALTLCLRKINHTFKGKHIGLPQIGCGLAGGVWDINELPTELDKQKFERLYGFYRDIKSIIQEELKDCNVTIVIYKPE